MHRIIAIGVLSHYLDRLVGNRLAEHCLAISSFLIVNKIIRVFA